LTWGRFDRAPIKKPISGYRLFKTIYTRTITGGPTTVWVMININNIVFILKNLLESLNHRLFILLKFCI
jgi:hypothetical protein